jgi:hypothetical protein
MSASNCRGVQFTDVRWLYSCDYYDGPLSGMTATSEGDLWARCIVDIVDNPDGDRVFELLRLTDDAMAAEATRHALFRQHVGTHTDYEPDGNLPTGATWSKERWHLFYDQYPPDAADDMAGEVVGWFEI